jgi:thiamine biosynthesis protein ThiI
MKSKTVFQNVILARMGEIALKGLNRGKFERQLLLNIRSAISGIGRFSVYQNQSRLWIEDADTVNPALTNEEAAQKVLHAAAGVFGLVSVSLVRKFAGEMDEIVEMATLLVEDLLAKDKFQTFKVETKRGNKKFPLGSYEISSEVGAKILDLYPQLTVDVKNPQVTVFIEIREYVYIYSNKIAGFRGLPCGSSGKGMLLLSGGIDSPVAGFMMASRGMRLDAIYFHSFPYTSNRAKEKVIDLAKILSVYTGHMTLHIVNFTEIQMELYKNSPQDMLTVTMRRIMIRIAQIIGIQCNCKALITGESLGQVASQTLEAIVLTDEVSDMPVFRPLIGLDKDYTTQIARQIGSFETSILPFEDCCTVFVAKHPQTHPQKRHIIDAEKNLDIDALVQKGVDSIERIEIE